MAFRKTSNPLTKLQSVRVPDDFPAQLKTAAAKAGVPHGLLLSQLVDRYLNGDNDGLQAQAALAAAREHFDEAARILYGETPADARDEPNATTRDLDELQDRRRKLTDTQVSEMRDLANQMTQVELAERFGISQTQVSLILSGQSRRDPIPLPVNSETMTSNERDGFWNGTGTEDD